MMMQLVPASLRAFMRHLKMMVRSDPFWRRLDLMGGSPQAEAS